MKVMSLRRLAVLAAVLLTGVGLTGCGDAGSTTARQAEVREAGAEVMPFDIQRAVSGTVG